MNAQSPKLSMLGVHPTGLASSKKADDLTTGFGPYTPDYGGIAKSATGVRLLPPFLPFYERLTHIPHLQDQDWLTTFKILPTVSRAEIEEIFIQAINIVREEKKGVVVECVIETV